MRVSQLKKADIGHCLKKVFEDRQHPEHQYACDYSVQEQGEVSLRHAEPEALGKKKDDYLGDSHDDPAFYEG
jgi:hypothetical protein